MIRVVRGQALGKRRCRQILIRGKECHCERSSGANRRLNIKGGSKLNSIVSTQAMFLRQLHCPIYNTLIRRSVPAKAGEEDIGVKHSNVSHS